MTPRNLQSQRPLSKPAIKPLSRAVHVALLGMALALPLGLVLPAQPAWAQTSNESSFDINQIGVVLVFNDKSGKSDWKSYYFA